MEPTREAAAKVRARWLANGVAVRPGATEAELARFETDHQVRLSDEFRTYLTVVNGMTDWETDDELIEFLSLGRIAEELSEAGEGAPQLLPVAQYCLYAYMWALRVSPQSSATSPVYSLERSLHVPLFDSFTDFLEAYLEDPKAPLR